MLETASALEQRIAANVRERRRALGWSLHDLAARSGVSRSTISLVERAETSATAVLLEKLATGLGVTLASLFDTPERSHKVPTGPVARRKDQPQWQDPASGYRRRNVSPAGAPQPMRIVEVHFPPRARVAFETRAREPHVQQQVWVLEGAIDVTVGKVRHKLRTGDCLAMDLDAPVMFHNPSRTTTRYAVVIANVPAIDKGVV
jgi:transcriptional regulator with XRE-family HTH domain